MKRLFGTDGIRGRAGECPLDPTTLFRVGEALSRRGLRRVILGRDTRQSGPWIEDVLTEAIQKTGGQVTRAGIISTPGISYLSRTAPFDAGIMISASHNPYGDNGIKIFSSDGLKLTDRQENALEALIAESTGTPDATIRDPRTEELRWSAEELVESYATFLKKVPGRRSLRGLKISLDCANGAAFAIAGKVFQSLGAEVRLLNAEPDGRNINSDCGALHPEILAQDVVANGCDLGMAFDGDADRIILVDHLGRIVDGDFILFVLACHLDHLGVLSSRCVVTTVMANIGLEVALRHRGLQMVRTRVGDRYVLERMISEGHDLGGEQSGHVILRRESLAGDGILVALKVAEILLHQDKSLAELCGQLEKFPQILLNIRVREKPDFSSIPEIQSEIEAARQALGEEGRVVIRYSGTEPLARVMVEGRDEKTIQGFAHAIAGRFETRLGLSG